MQRAMHDRATICVADRADLSGRATADEDRFHNRIRKVCALVGAALILPASAKAGPPTSIPAEIAALQTQVAALQTQVNALQNQLAVQTNKALGLGPFASVDPNPENPVIGPEASVSGGKLNIAPGVFAAP